MQFRKSKSFGGLRFTASKRGISTSFGAGPVRVSHGADGKLRRTVRIPGTGLYDTRVIGGPAAAEPAGEEEAPSRLDRAEARLSARQQQLDQMRAEYAERDATTPPSRNPLSSNSKWNRAMRARAAAKRSGRD